MSDLAVQPSAPAFLTVAERESILSAALVNYTRGGWRVVHRGEAQAQLMKGKNTSHLLHLVLSIITVGLWIPVWILVAILGGQKQRFLTVDEFGRVRSTR